MFLSLAIPLSQRVVVQVFSYCCVFPWILRTRVCLRMQDGSRLTEMKLIRSELRYEKSVITQLVNPVEPCTKRSPWLGRAAEGEGLPPIFLHYFFGLIKDLVIYTSCTFTKTYNLGQKGLSILKTGATLRAKHSVSLPSSHHPPHFNQCW